MVTAQGTTITVETKTLTATIERGFLTSLKSKRDGKDWLSGVDPSGSALQLLYPGQGTTNVIGNIAAEITAHQLFPTRAELRFSGWDADGVLVVSEDEATGDLVVEPSAYSSRAGVLSARWLLQGIDPSAQIVAPFFQGVKLDQDDPLLRFRWAWPMFWEAGFVIFQGPSSGFWVRCEDDRYRYKALNIDETGIGLETESYGPVDTTLGAGGLEWRISVYEGDWQVPAGQYRDWLRQAYRLDELAAARKPWLHDVRFALSWYGGDLDLLDAVAERIDPGKVLVHYSQWRTDGYDENYPTYEPSAHALQAFEKANAMGFHTMPHCNSVDMDPTHPAYHYLRDFQYRDVQTRGLHGWGYDPDHGGVLGVPNSYHSLSRNRRRKVMIKVHPGLSMWRSILAENILGAVEKVGTDGVFIDVTLCSGNLHNALVENTTASEGMNRLIRHIAALGDGLAVGGEGLNEITMQGCSFSQAHLFRSWHESIDGLERAGGGPLNEFLWGDISRTFGYSGLRGDTDESRLRMRIHEEHGAIPTVTVGGAEEIRNPSPGVQRQIDLALA